MGSRDRQNATARMRYSAARLAAKAAIVFGIGPRFLRGGCDGVNELGGRSWSAVRVLSRARGGHYSVNAGCSRQQSQTV